MVYVGIARDKFGDRNVASSKCLQSILIHLNQAFSGFTEGLHRRVESNNRLFAMITDLHLIEIDVRYLSIAHFEE